MEAANDAFILEQENIELIVQITVTTAGVSIEAKRYFFRVRKLVRWEELETATLNPLSLALMASVHQIYQIPR